MILSNDACQERRVSRTCRRSRWCYRRLWRLRKCSWIARIVYGSVSTSFEKSSLQNPVTYRTTCHLFWDRCGLWTRSITLLSFSSRKRVRPCASRRCCVSNRRDVIGELHSLTRNRVSDVQNYTTLSVNALWQVHDRIPTDNYATCCNDCSKYIRCLNLSSLWANCFTERSPINFCVKEMIFQLKLCNDNVEHIHVWGVFRNIALISERNHFNYRARYMLFLFDVLLQIITK